MNKYNEKTDFKIPILFLVFNRPETTIKVFNEIKKVKPKKLYIAADGPRDDNFYDEKACREVRELILNNINWNCEIKTLLREKNLGCRLAVSKAIDWFFENEEMGIIIEDDCLPNHSFFYFCKELLEKYENDTRIMMISGDNFQGKIKRGNASYYFSRYSNIWGWATWKRAWKYYDVNMKNFPKFLLENKFPDIFDCKYLIKYFSYIFKVTYGKKINTWAYQWCYTIFSQNGLCIVPNVNLVKNIGIGIKSTHTKKMNRRLFFINTEEITDIIHPEFLVPDKNADLLMFKKNGITPFKIILYGFKKFIKRILYKILK